MDVSSESDLDVVFPKLIELRAGGLVISGGQFFNSRSKQLAAKALQCSVPTIFPYVDFAAAGGLLSYGTSIIDAYRLAGIYTGRVLKGEKHMGTFRNETIKWLSIGLGIVVALYLLVVMIPMAQVPLYSDGIGKSSLRIGIEGRLHFLGLI